MSKKFTSFLVVLAALLLTVPTQAQFAKKAVPAGTQKFVAAANHSLKLQGAKQKAAIMKAKEAQVEGVAFTSVVSNSYLQASLEKVQEDKAILERQMKENLRETMQYYVKLVGPQARRQMSTVNFNAELIANASRRAEQMDEHGIITSPGEGTVKNYTRSGKAYKYDNNAVSVIDQTGQTQIVECEDGTVYIKDIVASYATGAWVKGTKSGNTITVPAKQPIYYVANYNATLSPRWATGEGTGNATAADDIDPNFTFIVDEAANTISLQNTTATQFMAVLWDDDNTYSGNGVYETVFTYAGEYVPRTIVTITPPAGLETTTWYTSGNKVVSQALSPFEGQVNIGFADDKVYIQGMFKDFPESWIMGTIEGTTVTFADLQYQGQYYSYDIYATGGDNSGLKDYVMTYDALSGTLSSENALFANADPDKISYLEYIYNINITKDAPTEPEATTGDPVDVLPYSNTLGTAAEFAQFGVIDSNKDGSTWAFNASNSAAAYTYSSANAADDWLVSPAIKLEAGKNYRVALDAANAGYPERFEVLIGAEPKASVLTTQVIAATDVTETTFTTVENSISVSETGYYHFGIHAISDADEFRLYVKNFIVEIGAEPTAPAAVTDFTAVATENKLEATVSFKAPTKTIGGEDLTDLTKIDVLRDGKVIKSLDGSETPAATLDASAHEMVDEASGDAIEGTVVLGAGINAVFAQNTASNPCRYWKDGTIRMYKNSTLKLSGSNITKVVVTFSGSNTALAADNFTVEGTTGVWTGSANEILFTADNGKAFIKTIQVWTADAAGLTPGAEYTVVDNAEDLTIGTHVYQVIPYNASGIGQKSEEKSVIMVVAVEVPYTFDFSEQSIMQFFQVIDANADNKTWNWDANYGAYYSYSTANDANDYLISLPVHFEAGKGYKIVVNANSYDENYPERFEVKVGKEATVDGLNITALSATDVASEEAQDFESEFIVSEEGNYYVAIHAISDANQWRLSVHSLKIEKGAEPTAPAAATALAVVAGAQAALEATISFNAPAKAVNGSDLTENLTKVDVLRDGIIVKTFEDVTPGAALSWKDETVENGKTYAYQVQGTNATGAGVKSEKVSAYVGFDIPAALDAESLTLADNVNNIQFGWAPVGNEGAKGYYVDPAQVTYKAWTVELQSFWGMVYPVLNEQIAEVTGETTLTANINTEEGEQTYQYFAIQPTNITGEGEEAYTGLLMGKSYDLPVVEGFAGSALHYYWDTNAALMVSEEAADGDGVALQMLAEEPGVVYLETGKINIKGTANPTFLFTAKSPNISNLYVYGVKDGGDMEVLSTVELKEDYQTYKLSLAGLSDASRFIQLAFVAQYATGYTLNDEGTDIADPGDFIMIDDIRVMDLYEYNLVADIQAPKSVVAGQKAQIVATVANEGENAVEGYKVTVKAGENVLTTVLGETLASFAKDEIEVPFETTIFDQAGDVTLTVEVEYENELLPEDNTASTIITITEPTAVAPTNLIAEDKGKDGVDLAWTAPELPSAPTAFEADFEEGFGEFTTIDADGDGYTWELGSAPVSYLVEGASLAGTGHNESQDFVVSGSYSNINGALTPDNFLVSPQVTLGGKLTFWAAGQDASYPAEHFGVAVSVAGNTSAADFTMVEEWTMTAAREYNLTNSRRAQGTWYKFEVDLSAYAGQVGYIAIRHFDCTDQFILDIDDISYEIASAAPANRAAGLASFNIYYNNEKIASVEGDKTTYTVAADKVEVGTQTFGVSAVYANGAESRVTTATIEIVTGIEQIAADGKPVDVYSIDGKLIRNQAKSLDGLKGLYIVNGKKIMVK